jgi:hypothetical protein
MNKFFNTSSVCSIKYRPVRPEKERRSLCSSHISHPRAGGTRGAKGKRGQYPPPPVFVLGAKPVPSKEFVLLYAPSQLPGRLSSPSQKMKKLSHPFSVCFELGIGILNPPRKIFWVVSGPILKLQGLQGVEFQGKNCFTKMASNFSEIDCGFR